MQRSSNPQTNSHRKLKKIPSSPQKYVINNTTNTNITSSRAISPQNPAMVMTVSSPSVKQQSNIQYYQYTAPESVTYKANQPISQGTFPLQNLGIFYEGSVLNNKFHGEGVLFEQHSLRPNKYIYKGSWKNGARNGFGHYIYPDGTEYKGDWKNNMKDGHGIYYNNRGQKYEGQWLQNQRHGNGRLQLFGGTILDGLWQNDQFVSGKVRYQDGSAYQGQIREYSRFGQGIYTYPDKSQYRGQWFNNMKHGNGQYYFPNGDQYRGGFRQNLKHGSNGRYLWREQGYELVDANFIGDVYQNGKLLQKRKA